MESRKKSHHAEAPLVRLTADGDKTCTVEIRVDAQYIVMHRVPIRDVEEVGVYYGQPNH